MTDEPKTAQRQQHWRPTATASAWRRRATLLATVRAFMAARDVMEVETPLLAPCPGSEPAIEPLWTDYRLSGRSLRLYLQSSPEAAMKRLLAAGAGSIYQVCRAFRAGEHGRLHAPEFTLLEWYRVGFDHHRLMQEITELLTTLGLPPAERQSYRDAFVSHLALDPFRATDAELAAAARDAGLASPAHERDALLDFLLAECIVPRLGRRAPMFIYDFPASQAMQARVRSGTPPLAERFELFIHGMEIANGYHELTDAHELERRCREQLRRRTDALPLDHALLAAVRHGLPACAGVALGMDRLLLALLPGSHLQEVLTFPLDAETH